jgi:endonuclease/exonuclease/phosphatase family metal-dependent hydrolase
MTLRVATYNIHRCIGCDGVERPKRIAAVLREMNADVAALQEVAFAVEPYRNNILTYLARAMNAIAIAGPTLLEKKGHYGNAILSRIPPERIDRLDISVPGREPRGAIAVKLRVNGKSIKIVATHLGLRPAERRYQMNHLSSLVNDPEAETTILLGDFNEWLSWGRPLRWMNRRFGKTPAPATFPSRRPVLALDRIWVDPADRLISLDCHRQMPARLASDHLPLVANVAI